MKSIITAMLLAVLGQTAFASQVLLTVSDDEGRPVPQAETDISFLVTGQDIPVRGMTDARGQVRASQQSFFGYDIMVRKSGFYTVDLRIQPTVDRLDRTFVLRAKRNPIPLYARKTGQWPRTDMDLPAENEWLGYDFEAGDWVAPHGQGRTTDIRFRYRHEFVRFRFRTPQELTDEIRISKEIAIQNKVEWTEERFRLMYGLWSGELEISFPGEKEGVIEVTDQFLPYSQMKMPHEAPADGYRPAPKYALNNFSPTGLRDNVGFFLRTRVKLDDKGNLVSANYAKVIGDFQFGATGTLAFIYYFNPTANDRNLELDPPRNLFPGAPPGAVIRNP